MLATVIILIKADDVFSGLFSFHLLPFSFQVITGLCNFLKQFFFHQSLCSEIAKERTLTGHLWDLLSLMPNI